MKYLRDQVEDWAKNDPEVGAMMEAIDQLGENFSAINPAVTDEERKLFRNCLKTVAFRVALYAREKIEQQQKNRLN